MSGGAVVDVRIEAKWFRSARGERRAVLRRIAFSARAGEVLALLGPSGVGKSTTLRIVLGLEHDFAGHVTRHAERIAAVFQEPCLVPWLSVAGNLRLVIQQGSQAADITPLLDEVGLPGAETHYPGELSLGMARRAALARALVVRPDFLVLDEPFASLDPLLSATLARIVAQRARQYGTTVLIATHNVDQAVQLADRVLVLSGEPATLAFDQAVPDRADTAAIEALRRSILLRFPFLAAEPEPPALSGNS
ncbi:MAG: ABC transporter ATP-binding protein [Acetobacteraceae bacterium]|nr:ABC transporter ATP-binding protein [Acetobacteraceae bacterium]